MPSLASLLKAEGLEISPELESKLPTLTEASDEVRGLVATKEKLLNWKQENADKVSGFDEIQAKYQTELDEREKLAISNKDYKEQIKIRDERAEAQDEIIKSSRERTLKSVRESNQSQIASMFSDQFQGTLIAKNLFSSAINDSGEVETTYNLNGEVFDNIEDLKVAAGKNESLAKLIAGPQSSGPSGKGGKGGGEPSATNKEADAAKEKGDAIGHANAHLANVFK